MGEKRLNLGCGKDIRPGWVNLDIAPLEGVDVVHDLNELPLPFEEETFAEILCLDILEHVEFAPLLKECLRILEPGGKLVLEVPHFSSSNNYVDPTHRNRFSVKTFNFFCRDSYEYRNRGHYYFDFSFSKCTECRLSFHQAPSFFWNYLISAAVNCCRRSRLFYEATGLTYLFPAQNIRITLEK